MPPHGKAYEAMALIEANFQRPLSIKEIANALRITPDYLATIFEQTFGISPKLQIRNLRLTQAHSLLVATDKSAKEIAYAVGYQSPNVFEQAFQQYFSPGNPLQAIPEGVRRELPLPFPEKRSAPGLSIVSPGRLPYRSLRKMHHQLRVCLIVWRWARDILEECQLWLTVTA